MHVSSMYSSSTPAAASSSSSSTSSTTSSSSSSGLDPTFMSLLLAELQSQDPTAPMDTTAMVGQMVSLNQLDELISIQGILQNSLGSSTTASTSGTNSAQSQHSSAVAANAHSALPQQSTNPWPAGTTAPTSNTQFSNGAN